MQVWRSGEGAETLDQGRTYVPLRTSDRIVGVMDVGPKRGQALDADERRLLTVFAAQAALVIAQAENEEARHRLEVVEESDRLKSALLNAVSHDLRTPLASIKAAATALLLADAPWRAQQGREFLEAIDHETDRLNRLVGSLLDLSRIEAGALRPALEWYDIREVMDGILTGTRLVAAESILNVEVDPDISAVHLDRLRIEELVINLVDNAVKYSSPGSPIEIGVRREGGGISLAVTDHGPGVPAEVRPRIFETFYQGQQHGDRRKGTGLGLAICRGIAEAHGGTIRVEDTPGGGATFVLTLPPARILNPENAGSLTPEITGSLTPENAGSPTSEQAGSLTPANAGVEQGATA
jgi:two-component system sensor histidine kinase KdpD